MFKLSDFFLGLLIWVFSCGVMAGTSAEKFNIYINDEGEQCVILIDVASLNIKNRKSAQEDTRLHDYLEAALKTIPPQKCTPSPAWEVTAITMGGCDAYGQPNWNEVIVLQSFHVNPVNLTLEAET